MKTRRCAQLQAQAISPVTAEGDLQFLTAVGLVDDPDDHTCFTPCWRRRGDYGVRATLADAGYYSGTLGGLRWQGPGGGHAGVIARRQSRDHPYHKERFAYDESNDSFMCPQGQVIPFKRIHIPPNGVHSVYTRHPVPSASVTCLWGVSIQGWPQLTVGERRGTTTSPTWMATSAATKVYK